MDIFLHYFKILLIEFYSHFLLKENSIFILHHQLHHSHHHNHHDHHEHHITMTTKICNLIQYTKYSLIIQNGDGHTQKGWTVDILLRTKVGRLKFFFLFLLHDFILNVKQETI